MDDNHLDVQLSREDARYLIYVLEPLIEDQAGTGTGTLLRGLHTALIDAFGHVKPERPADLP